MARKKIRYEYSRAGVEQSILASARSARIPEGWAKQIAKRVADGTDRWIEDKDTVTEGDLRRVIVRELKEISPELAFAYSNHDKII